MNRDELITTNMNLVGNVIKKYFSTQNDKEDLYQVGCIGLIKAADQFDINRGIKFSTYATHKIIGEIRNYCRDNAPIHVTPSIKKDYAKIMNEREKYINIHAKEPSTLELSQILNMDIRKVDDAILSSREIFSLDENIFSEGEEVYLKNIIVDLKANEEINFNLLLEDLTERQRNFLLLKYEHGLSQIEIANLVGNERKTVSRHLRKAVKSLQI